jgi:alcohol dehydrogenase (cytochrome c)
LAPALSSNNAALGIPDLQNGAELYQQTCLPCHGEDGRGGHGGGLPLNSLTDIEQVLGIVDAGRNAMPPFNAALTPQQILDVSAYVLDAFSGE